MVLRRRRCVENGFGTGNRVIWKQGSQCLYDEPMRIYSNATNIPRCLSTYILTFRPDRANTGLPVLTETPSLLGTRQAGRRCGRPE